MINGDNLGDLRIFVKILSFRKFVMKQADHHVFNTARNRRTFFRGHRSSFLEKPAGFD